MDSFGGWLLIAILSLLVGLLIGWLLWYLKWKKAKETSEDLQKKTQSLEKDNSRLQTELDSCRDNVSRVKRNNENLQKKAQSLEKDYAKLQSELDGCHNTVSMLKKDNAAVQNELDGSRENASMLKKDKDLAQADLNKQRESIAAMKKDNEAMQVKLNSQLKDSENLRNKTQSLEKDNTALQSKLDGCRENASTLKKDSDLAKDKLNECRNNAAEIQKDKEAMQVELDSHLKQEQAPVAAEPAKPAKIEAVHDKLSTIKGIDPDIEKGLNSKDITSFKDLALMSNDDVDAVEADLGLDAGRIRKENWTHQAAQQHFEQYKEPIYDQVKVDAVYETAFDAQLAESKKGVVLDYTDDLKIISGVGPKMENMLNDFGITTFYHLSKLDSDGVEALNQKLDFFQGRIERDDWVGQAKKLYEEMHK